MKLRYTAMPTWPALAWLAKCRRGSTQVHVIHGDRVEIADDWFAEAVWAGEFEAGDFDGTDLVAGSGGRLRDNRLYFVSPGSTVERLHTISDDETIWVSNSLCCVLAAAAGRLDPTYPRYYHDFASVVRGLSEYTRFLGGCSKPLELVYFDNLVWDGNALQRLDKPGPRRDFSSFAKYREFLAKNLALVSGNLAARARRYPYRMLGTLSSGYDSATVSTLAREAGCEEVLCFDRAWPEARREQSLRSGVAHSDSGAEVAHFLGLRVINVPLQGWRNFTMPEIPFLAANAMGEEVRFRTAEPHLAGRVLLTGYHGDKMWAKKVSNLSPDIVRGDPSGSALGEYRLWVGFLHCPIAFWGVRQIGNVNRISTSPDMERWDVPGEYSRPICRRTVESAGVPREAFGIRKLAASVMLHDEPEFLTADSMSDYLGWLGERRAEWLKRGAIPPVRGEYIDRLSMRARENISAWLKRLPLLWRVPAHLGIEYEPTRLRRALFPWAVERAMVKYSGMPIDRT